MSGIGPEDIDAFMTRWGDSLKAADKYATRKEAGLHPDRWADGSYGEHMVANGIRAQQRLLKVYAAIVSDMQEQERKRNLEAMDIS